MRGQKLFVLFDRPLVAQTLNCRTNVTSINGSGATGFVSASITVFPFFWPIIDPVGVK